MSQQKYLQDVIGPNLTNYRATIIKSVSHIFAAFHEYFKIDPFVKSFGKISQENETIRIDFKDLAATLNLSYRLVIDSAFLPEAVISINCVELEEPTILLVKVTRFGRAIISNNQMEFDSACQEVDYDASYLPAQILSRALQILINNKTISI
ncbi:hypothetical protein [Enterobacter mori]|uniref:hypothetical protein n=1 Tax=Enterobacter mori TaxID=539813 RepID=UPI000D37AA58|nr:hypothetical protein [Enterobacter mori]